MIRFAYSFLQHGALSAADLALIGDLMLLGFAVAALAFLLRMIWRLLRSIVLTMAHLLSWAIAVTAVAFLLFRLVRFFG